MHINVHTQQSRREGEGDREEGAAVRIAGEKGGGGGGGEKRPRFASLPASISSSRGEWKSRRKGGRSFVRSLGAFLLCFFGPSPPSLRFGGFASLCGGEEAKEGVGEGRKRSVSALPEGGKGKYPRKGDCFKGHKQKQNGKIRNKNPRRSKCCLESPLR